MRKINGIGTAFSAIACCFFSVTSLTAQIYSSNIVGYINLPIYAGNNFVANQLDNSAGDTLNVLFQNNIPEGSTFTEWDSSQLLFLPVSTYDTNNGWSINYQLTFGGGGLFNSPSTFTNTFIGSVWPGFVPPGTFTPPLISNNGLALISSYVPLDPTTFYDVMGRQPAEGDYVEILNALSQVETTTTFHNGAWDNGTPLLGVGESAFFGEDGISAVPEPGSVGLFGAGALGLALFRRFRGA